MINQGRCAVSVAHKHQKAKHIGPIDPYALKIPARRAESLPNRSDGCLIFTLNQNKILEGLQASDFSVRTNHARSTIRSITHPKTPVSVGIVLDTSGSMTSRSDNFGLATAAVDVILSASGPQDEYFLEYANQGASARAGFTGNLSSIRAGVNVRPKGPTALIDSIYFGINEMRKAHHPSRSLIVLSDGEDNDSIYRLADAAAAFRTTPVPVFLVLLINPERRVLKENNDIQSRDRLIDFAERTGGASIILSDKKRLVEITSELSKLIRNPYILRLDAAIAPNDLRDVRVEIPLMRPRPKLLYRQLWPTGLAGDPNRLR